MRSNRPFSILSPKRLLRVAKWRQSGKTKEDIIRLLMKTYHPKSNFMEVERWYFPEKGSGAGRIGAYRRIVHAAPEKALDVSRERILRMHAGNRPGHDYVRLVVSGMPPDRVLSRLLARFNLVQHPTFTGNGRKVLHLQDADLHQVLPANAKDGRSAFFAVFGKLEKDEMIAASRYFAIPSGTPKSFVEIAKELKITRDEAKDLVGSALFRIAREIDRMDHRPR